LPDSTETVSHGVIISGLYLNGAKWDSTGRRLIDIEKNSPYNLFPNVKAKYYQKNENLIGIIDSRFG